MKKFEIKIIANSLTAQTKVKVTEGTEWKYNFANKEITYPLGAVTGMTKNEFIATLLHESGHVLFSTSPELLLTEIEENDRKAIHHLFNLIEDFRMEDKVRQRYPFAYQYLPDFNTRQQEMMKVLLSRSRNNYHSYLGLAYMLLNGGKKEVKGTSQGGTVKKVLEQTKEILLRARKTQSTVDLWKVVKEELYPLVKPLFPNDLNSVQEITSLLPSQAQEEPRSYDPYPEIRKDIAKTVAILKKKLPKNFFSGLAGGFRSGRNLDTKKLYKFAVEDYRLFSRKIKEESFDYAFCLVVDESGSMRESEKNMRAADTACLFSEVLRTSGIPYSILGFNASIRWYKKFNEEKPLRPIYEKIVPETFTSDAGDNYDHLAVDEAYKAIQKVSAKRKVIIVLSDGQPTGWWSGGLFASPEDKLRDSVQEVRKAEIIGVGIQSYAVENFYRKHIFVKDSSNLPGVIASLITQFLTNRG